LGGQGQSFALGGLNKIAGDLWNTLAPHILIFKNKRPFHHVSQIHDPQACAHCYGFDSFLFHAVSVFVYLPLFFC
jgi:hypothetical protein